MKSPDYSFDSIVEIVYNLPLEEKEELKNLLENNIADNRRDQMAANASQSEEEEKSGRLQFSSKIDDLKKML